VGGASIEVALLAHPPVSRSPAEMPPGPPPPTMHEDDRLLLARAKWLVSTFTAEGADSAEGSRKASAVLSSGQQSTGHHMSRSRTQGPDTSPSPSIAVTAGLGTGNPLQESSAVLEEYEEKEEHKRRSVESMHWPSADGRMLLSFIDFLVEV
jgi:choline dehydrogenase-like flavoprotein